MSKIVSAPQAVHTTTTQEDKSLESLFEQVLNRTPSAATKKFTPLETALLKHLDKMESILPASLKGHSERFIRRAIMTFNRTQGLDECTVESLMQCIIGAAELGLAIDGRLAHAVKFKTKVGESWEARAQLIIDYKGKIAIARRNKTIMDIYGDVVWSNDEFTLGREGKKDLLHHVPNIKDRGEVIGAYMIVVLPNGEWHHCWMGIKELDYIQSRSKAKDFGPWKTDINEMRKKTVVNRALKPYLDVDTILAGSYSEDELEEISVDTPQSIKELSEVITAAPPEKPSSALFDNSPDAQRM